MEYFFWRFEKRITLSEKKPPLAGLCIEMRVILVKEIYQNAIFPPTCLQALQIFEGNFQSHMNTSELVQAQTAKMRLLSFEIIVYKSRGELFLLKFRFSEKGTKI